jgi:hypothetical protein
MMGSIDYGALIETLKRQRNGALDDAALLSGRVAQLEAEVAVLREQSAKAATEEESLP